MSKIIRGHIKNAYALIAQPKRCSNCNSAQVNVLHYKRLHIPWCANCSKILDEIVIKLNEPEMHHYLITGQVFYTTKVRYRGLL